MGERGESAVRNIEFDLVRVRKRPTRRAAPKRTTASRRAQRKEPSAKCLSRSLDERDHPNERGPPLWSAEGKGEFAFRPDRGRVCT